MDKVKVPELYYSEAAYHRALVAAGEELIRVLVPPYGKRRDYRIALRNCLNRFREIYVAKRNSERVHACPCKGTGWVLAVPTEPELGAIICDCPAGKWQGEIVREREAISNG